MWSWAWGQFEYMELGLVISQKKEQCWPANSRYLLLLDSAFPSAHNYLSIHPSLCLSVYISSAYSPLGPRLWVLKENTVFVIHYPVLWVSDEFLAHDELSENICRIKTKQLPLQFHTLTSHSLWIRKTLVTEWAATRLSSTISLTKIIRRDEDAVRDMQVLAEILMVLLNSCWYCFSLVGIIQ